MKLGAELRRLRKGKGYTQEKLAELVGVSRESIQKYEVNVNHPPLEVAMVLAEYVGVCVDQLIRGEVKCPASLGQEAALARRIRSLSQEKQEAVQKIVEALEKEAGC